MGLQEDFLKLLQDREDFTSTDTTSKWDLSLDQAFKFPEVVKEERESKNAIWDALGAGAWAFANEALWGVPGATLKKYGGEGAQEFLEAAAPDTKLGNIVLEQGEWDSEGNETKAPVLSDKFHVDVFWNLSDTYNDDGELVKAELPSGWASSSVDISDNGVHMFAGLDYTEHKFL